MKHSLLLFSLLLLLCGCDWQTSANTTSGHADHDAPAAEAPTNPSTNGEAIRPLKGKEEDSKVRRMAFYNVENLFDTQNAPSKADEDFTPKGRYKWDKGRYQKKLRNIAKVIHFMGQPGLMGLAEVENRKVLEDLIADPYLKEAQYGIVHHESPDHRGIDVALLYSKDEYELRSTDFIAIDFPASVVQNYSTREILHATLQDKAGEYFHLLVCHWPSRRGGVEASEPKRLYVAEQVRKKVDQVFRKYDGNHVIVMGDLNDEPHQKSVHGILGASKPSSKPQAESLYNLVAPLEEQGYATHNYQGEWNMLDHIIVSGTLLDGKGTEASQPQIFNRDWMLYYHRDSKQYRPSRTFSGNRYYGDYSDHLPVLVELRR